MTMKIENHTMFDVVALPLVGPRGDNLLTVIVKGTFTFDNGHSHPADEQLPIEYGDCQYPPELGGGVRYESDVVAFKPRTDIVLNATAYAPDNRPTESVPVAVKVGSIEKRLLVFGERYWNHSGLFRNKYVITATKPFVRQPIIYAHAYGGIDPVSGSYCAENLVGTGCYGLKPQQNLAGKPLPRIEDPRCLIKNVEDRPTPAGFGFYHRSWQPRAGFAGTYDDNWRQHRCPLPPEDFDARFNNGAHPDLQANGYLKGGESVELHNLTPQGRCAFSLARVPLACRLVGLEKPQLIAMNLDTLFIEPDEHRYCLVWRAAAELPDPDASGFDAVHIGIMKK